MPLESCLTTPPNERFRVYKQSHITFCKGDCCSAGLIDFFERWHTKKVELAKKNIKSNDIAEMHHDTRSQDETLYQFHTLDELRSGLMEMFSINTIRKSLKYLIEQKQIISAYRNPNPRYRFDKTNYYLFHPEIFNDWVNKEYAENIHSAKNIAAGSITPDLSNLIDRSCKSASLDLSEVTDRRCKIDRPSCKFDRAITNKTNNKNKKQQTTNQLTESLEFELSENTQIKVSSVGCSNLKNNKNPKIHASVTNSPASAISETPLKRSAPETTPPVVDDKGQLESGISHATQTCPQPLSQPVSSPAQSEMRDVQQTTHTKNSADVPTFANPEKKKSQTPSISALQASEEKTRATNHTAFSRNRNAAPSAMADRIGAQFTNAQETRLQQALSELTDQQKVSYPAQLQAEISFALLDPATLDGCHYSFTRKLSVIVGLICKNRWRTPSGMRRTNSSTAKTPQAIQTIDAKDNTIAFAENNAKIVSSIDNDIRTLQAKIMSDERLLECSQHTSGYTALKTVLTKQHAQAKEKIRTLLKQRQELFSEEANGGGIALSPRIAA